MASRPLGRASASQMTLSRSPAFRRFKSDSASPVDLRGGLGGEQRLVDGLGLFDLTGLAIAVGQHVLEGDVLGVAAGGFLQSRGDVGLTMEGRQNLGLEL